MGGQDFEEQETQPLPWWTDLAVRVWLGLIVAGLILCATFLRSP